MLTGVVLANHTRFGNVIILQNLASDIALSVRQAQVYGIAVRRCDPTVTAVCTDILNNAFDLAYGVHFMVDEPGFELFADVDDNAEYSPGETVISTEIKPGYRVSRLCRTNAVTDVEVCDLTELNVVFRRPEPDACIDGVFDEDGDCISVYGRARITVESNKGDTARVTVESTGQISAQ